MSFVQWVRCLYLVSVYYQFSGVISGRIFLFCCLCLPFGILCLSASRMSLVSILLPVRMSCKSLALRSPFSICLVKLVQSAFL